MRSRHSRPLIIVIAVILLLVAFSFAFTPQGISFATLSALVGHRERQILYRVDHSKLASELRTFATTRRWSTAPHRERPDHFSGDDSELPSSVRTLKPTAVWLLDDRIDVEFGGPLVNFGIRVFPEGIKGDGVKELGQGIWFYADDGKLPSKWGL